MKPKIRKLNFAEMGRTLTRAEMKEIIAGYGPGGCGDCNCVICYSNPDVTSACVPDGTCIIGNPMYICSQLQVQGLYNATFGICDQCC